MDKKEIEKIKQEKQEKVRNNQIIRKDEKGRDSRVRK